jgi:hypothetical protein
MFLSPEQFNGFGDGAPNVEPPGYRLSTHAFFAFTNPKGPIWRLIDWVNQSANPMRDKTKIHQKAREAIQAGKVPNRCPQRMWGGPGSGACCAVCGDSVTQDEFEMELEFARGDGDSGVVEYLFHVSCYTAWDSERRNFNGMARGTMVGGGRTPTARS